MLVNMKLEIKVEMLLDELILRGRAKRKLAMLTFLYCGEFVKNSLLSSGRETMRFNSLIAHVFVF